MKRVLFLVLSTVLSVGCFAQGEDDTQQVQIEFTEQQLYGTWKLVSLKYVYSVETNKPDEYLAISENNDLYHEYTFDEEFLRMSSWVDDYNKRGKKNGKKMWNNHVWSGRWRINWGTELQTRVGSSDLWISYENMSVYSISPDGDILQLKQRLLGYADDSTSPMYRVWTYTKGSNNIAYGTQRK